MNQYEEDALALSEALLTRRRKLVDSFVHKSEPSSADLQLFALVNSAIGTAGAILVDEEHRRVRAEQQAELYKSETPTS